MVPNHALDQCLRDRDTDGRDLGAFGFSTLGHLFPQNAENADLAMVSIRTGTDHPASGRRPCVRHRLCQAGIRGWSPITPMFWHQTGISIR